MSQNFDTTIGLSADFSSAGQPFDFDGAFITNLVITNNSGVGIQYSTDGTTWSTINPLGTASPSVPDSTSFYLRKMAAGGAPASVRVQWRASDSIVGIINGQPVIRPILSLLKRKAVSAQQFNPLDSPSLSGIAVTNTTGGTDSTLAVAVDLRSTQNTGKYLLGGGAAVGSSGLPVKAASILLSSNVGVTGAYQTGPWLEFMVPPAATSARVNLFVGNGAYTSQFRIAVDGRYLTRAMTAYSSTAGVFNYLTIDLSSYDTGAARRIRVEWDGFASAQSISVNAGFIWQPYYADALNAVVYGDSFVAYGSGRSPHTSAPAQAMQRMGLNYTMSGVGGTGYIANGSGNLALSDPSRIADLTLAGTPDMVVITAGTNDVASTASAVTAAALSTFRAIRTLLPSTPIFVTGVWNGQAGSGIITMAQAETAVQAAFAAWADSNSFFVPICGATGGAWITAGNSAALIADGTHFNATGEWYAGQRLAAGIGAALANY